MENKTTTDVMKLTGLSRCRLCQFARHNNVTQLPLGRRDFVWTQADIDLLIERRALSGYWGHKARKNLSRGE